MPIVNRMAELHKEITQWRREIHSNPELAYDVHETAASVAGKLEQFGCDEVISGIGRTGVVGVIHGKAKSSGTVIGLRADMDALPIEEKTGKPYASKINGKMHACGHDGHTAMLLGAAKYLCETRNFDGTVVVIFQPAEEGGAGAKAMVDDGLMDRFGIKEVYGMHNSPGVPVGEFEIKSGPVMAATDEFFITISARGSHAAMPHEGVDPIVVASQVVVGLQSIVSRNLNPFEPLVISTTNFHAGSATNVIPNDVKLAGTIRSLSKETRDMAIERLKSMVEGICSASGAVAKIQLVEGYPATVNHEVQTQKAAEVAEGVGGRGSVNTDMTATMGGEDFSYMLLERPGAFIFMGNGDTAGLHHPEYDFNDEAIPYGTSYWARLAETLMPAK